MDYVKKITCTCKTGTTCTKCFPPDQPCPYFTEKELRIRPGSKFARTTKYDDAFDVLPFKKVKTLAITPSSSIILVTTKPNSNGRQAYLAVKEFSLLDQDGYMKTYNIALVIQEAMILKAVYHKNIVPCWFPLIARNNAVIVMDYIDGGTLDEHIYTLKEPEIHRYFIQIAIALRHIHSKRILHRDLKLQNVVIRDQNAFVIDFGLSQRLPLTGNSFVRGLAGTGRFMAPEVVSYPNTRIPFDGFKSDSFSLGVILWSLVMKKLPLDRTKVSPFGIKRWVDPSLMFCMRVLMRTNPDLRYDVTTLLSELRRKGYRHTPKEFL